MTCCKGMLVRDVRSVSEPECWASSQTCYNLLESITGSTAQKGAELHTLGMRIACTELCSRLGRQSTVTLLWQHRHNFARVWQLNLGECIACKKIQVAPALVGTKYSGKLMPSNTLQHAAKVQDWQSTEL